MIRRLYLLNVHYSLNAILRGTLSWTVVMAFLGLMCAKTVFAGGEHDHAIPTLKDQAKTTVTIQGNTVTVTFGPIRDPAPITASGWTIAVGCTLAAASMTAM